MVRETHADPKVIDYLNDNFIPVRVEARQNTDLAQQWNVRGVPLTLVLSPEAQEIKRLEGFQPPAHYITELQSVKA